MFFNPRLSFSLLLAPFQQNSEKRQDFQDLGFARGRFQVRASSTRAFLRSLQDFASPCVIFPGSWKSSRVNPRS